MLSREFRSASLVDAEIKGRMFRGYAAVFDTPWNDRLTKATGYVEEVSRGIFRKAIAEAPNGVPLLIQHEKNMMLGTTKSGNVSLREDGKGLLTEAKLPDNYLGEYARSMIESGDLRGMSYGIELDPQRDVILTRSASGVYTRKISRVENLLDVSLTWEPAYPETTIELRSANFVAPSLQEILSGAETQTEEAVAEAPPDEKEAWWGEDPPADPEAPRKPWEIYLDELEREV